MIQYDHHCTCTMLRAAPRASATSTRFHEHASPAIVLLSPYRSQTPTPFPPPPSPPLLHRHAHHRLHCTPSALAATVSTASPPPSPPPSPPLHAQCSLCRTPRETAVSEIPDGAAIAQSDHGGVAVAPRVSVRVPAPAERGHLLLCAQGMTSSLATSIVLQLFRFAAADDWGGTGACAVGSWCCGPINAALDSRTTARPRLGHSRKAQHHGASTALLYLHSLGSGV